MNALGLILGAIVTTIVLGALTWLGWTGLGLHAALGLPALTWVQATGLVLLVRLLELTARNVLSVITERPNIITNITNDG